MAKPKLRVYGHNGTIHGTTDVNVELDKKGNVLSVWFRCQPLPFTQDVVGGQRAKELKSLYKGHKLPKIHAITLED